ncbi:hypothetical protein TGDOM2_359040, partial [Toxoplasma gondii GAB2-2007-GAL-DOM2]
LGLQGLARRGRRRVPRRPRRCAGPERGDAECLRSLCIPRGRGPHGGEGSRAPRGPEGAAVGRGRGNSRVRHDAHASSAALEEKRHGDSRGRGGCCSAQRG